MQRAVDFRGDGALGERGRDLARDVGAGYPAFEFAARAVGQRDKDLSHADIVSISPAERDFSRISRRENRQMW